MDKEAKPQKNNMIRHYKLNTMKHLDLQETSSEPHIPYMNYSTKPNSDQPHKKYTKSKKTKNTFQLNKQTQTKKYNENLQDKINKQSIPFEMHMNQWHKPSRPWRPLSMCISQPHKMLLMTNHLDKTNQMGILFASLTNRNNQRGRKYMRKHQKRTSFLSGIEYKKSNRTKNRCRPNT